MKKQTNQVAGQSDIIKNTAQGSLEAGLAKLRAEREALQAAGSWAWAGSLGKPASLQDRKAKQSTGQDIDQEIEQVNAALFLASAHDELDRAEQMDEVAASSLEYEAKMDLEAQEAELERVCKAQGDGIKGILKASKARVLELAGSFRAAALALSQGFLGKAIETSIDKALAAGRIDSERALRIACWLTVYHEKKAGARPAKQEQSSEQEQTAELDTASQAKTAIEQDKPSLSLVKPELLPAPAIREEIKTGEFIRRLLSSPLFTPAISSDVEADDKVALRKWKLLEKPKWFVLEQAISKGAWDIERAKNTPIEKIEKRYLYFHKRKLNAKGVLPAIVLSERLIAGGYLTALDIDLAEQYKKGGGQLTEEQKQELITSAKKLCEYMGVESYFAVETKSKGLHVYFLSTELLQKPAL